MKRPVRLTRLTLLSIGLLLALQACGTNGGGGSPPASAVIGPAGGTLTSSTGAKVVVPPGALLAGTTLGIEQTSAGAPPLPGGLNGVGQMFAFTPHGTTFTQPVTVTLPFNPASVPAGGTPELYKTNAQNQWERVTGATFGANSVSGAVTGFSFGQVVVPPLQRNDPLREWTFSDYRGRGMTKTEIFSGSQTGGLFEDIRDFGGQFPFTDELLDHEITSVGGNVIPQDGRANGQVFSTADGVTYGVFAEAPYGNPNNPDSPAGSTVVLGQRQSFIKRAANASLSFTLTSAFIDLRDDNGGFNNLPSTVPACNYPPDQISALDACQDLVRGQLIMTVHGYTGGTLTTPGKTFYYVAGHAEMRGHTGNFVSNVAPSMQSRIPLWTADDFTGDISAGQNVALLEFRGPRTYTVDLSGIEVGEEFTLSSSVLAEATNRQGNKSRGGREAPSAAAAFLRDPLSIGGTTLTLTGLEPTNTPGPVPPVDVRVEPAPCVPGSGSAGVLGFSAAEYVVDEFGGATQPVRITRTGGSSGAVTATFTTEGGTAIGGTDYTPVHASVFFADGDAEERVAEIPILQNLTHGEPDRTIQLTLSQPGGCAALGTQTTAVLTLRDDDLPPPPSFTIGGTVTGLVGTGLVLNKVGDRGDLPITGNGPFTFPERQFPGFPYTVRVKTQPAAPAQVCTVLNGEGQAPAADVTDVEVNCATPAPVSGLDPSFGDGGKVSSAFGGDETAMALQADGKIVMVGGSVTDFALARYNTDGSPDTGFASAGTVTTDIATGADQARGVAVQSDGKIVVAGQAVVGRTANNLFNFDFALTRYNADGSLDTGFGTGGRVTTDFGGQTDLGEGVAIQEDGRIVVVGSAALGTLSGSADFAVARYHTDGTLDPGFGGDGKVTTDLDGEVDLARNVVVQPDGSLLVSGYSTRNNRDQTGLVRYDASGGLDPGFGSGGKVAVAGHRLDEGLALQGDGRIVLAGSASVGVFPARSSHFAVMRLTADGRPDPSFGTAGLATTAFSTSNDFGRAVALDQGGRVVVAGQSSNGSNPDFGVARFSPDGTLDPSFGSGGRLTLSFFDAFDGAESVAVQPDGRVVLGGFATNGTRLGYGLARVRP